MCDFICEPMPLYSRPVYYSAPIIERPWWSFNLFPSYVRPFHRPLLPRFGNVFVADSCSNRTYRVPTFNHRPYQHHHHHSPSLVGRTSHFGARVVPGRR